MREVTVRELRVIGLEPDGTHVVCADNESGERFRVPADDKLRAASRGDVARFGQIEIETESRIRPRDIQARIRAGATVEQVATEAGVPVKKIESFAHPVLLERARAAQMAQAGHPVRENGPTVLTLAEIVGLAFRARGHNLDEATWDAWRDDEGHWIAQLEWQAGRTRNAAHWRFQPDSHGGTIAPLDAAATDLIDPDFGRPLRGLAPISAEDPHSPALEAVIEAEVEEEVEESEPLEPGAMDSLFEEDEIVHSEDEEQRPKAAPQHQGAKDKRGKPALPSWDDVLLGVRSSGRG
jgi:hypothetical protein